MISITNPINDTSPSRQSKLTAFSNSNSRKLRSMPAPYGTIPKRARRKQKNSISTSANKQHTSTQLERRSSASSSSTSSSCSTATATTAPYPFFTPTSPSFFSFIVEKLFPNLTAFGNGAMKDPSCYQENGIAASPVGFMPCTPTHTNKTQTSELDIIVPITSSSPINCHYYSHYHYTNSMSDNSSLLSTSSSSFSSRDSNDSTSSSFDCVAADTGQEEYGSTVLSSSFSSLSSLTCFTDDARAYVRNGLKEAVYQCPLEDYASTHISTTTILSDILCDHYVQTQMSTATPSLSDIGATGEYTATDSDTIDVPLETFCIYEAPAEENDEECIHTDFVEDEKKTICQKDDHLSWMISYLLPNTESEQTKEWTLVETLSRTSKKSMRLSTKEQLEGSSESSNNEEKVGMTTVMKADDIDEEIEDNQAQAGLQNSSLRSNKKSSAITSLNKKNLKAYYLQQYHHNRDIRANAAYLRMIVAEVNMMRSQKIVGPLRQRRVLPKRTDRFIRRPSPLQLILI